jgi:hypothetical protein
VALTARPAWAPTVAQVGALMPTRFQGTPPTTETSPTAEQVDALIDMLAESLLAEVGPVGDLQVGLARTTLALGVASYIENGFIPEQSDENLGPAEFFRRRYAEHVSLLRRAIVTANRAQILPPVDPDIPVP